ncbi:hypothetical protein DL769_001872 [Monosporascus sp. CRB-8-3]|nr:hypothetical protein DL769_001872 [Monosporascus sp. CRB-8-3]
MRATPALEADVETADPVLSCSEGAQPGLVHTCCVETFGGLVLATQYWNTYTGLESEGQVLPKDTWTIHGLWPDFCNGSYTQYCDLRYWPGLNQPSHVLWAHEYSKHATCFSTFDTECYGSGYRAHEDTVDYFATTVSYYRRLPTWGWLAAGGVRPSNDTATRYSLSEIQGALAAGFLELPYVGCSGPRYNTTEAGRGSADDGYTILTEVWYYFHVFGRPQRRQALPVPANATGGRLSNCARTPGAIWYPERTEGSAV